MATKPPTSIYTLVVQQILQCPEILQVAPSPLPVLVPSAHAPSVGALMPVLPLDFNFQPRP